MKQRNTNLVKVFQVDNRKAETLIPLITQNFPAQAEIQSDGWPSYRCLPSLGYNLQTVNHTKNFVNPVTGANI